MVKTVDYILVGQGLAGTVLALTLQQKERSFYIFNADLPAASEAAAGLYNPVTGRKMVFTWKATSLFPFLEEFYARAEKQLRGRFLHAMPIYRPFLSVEEQNQWSAKSEDAVFGPFIAAVRRPGHYSDWIHDPLGGIELAHSGFLDIPAFLQAFRSRNAEYISEQLVADCDIKLEDGRVRIGDVQSDKLIICSGAYARKFSYFSWLPFRPVKGEVLEIEAPAHYPEIIFNRGVFILPTLRSSLRIGATYDHGDLSTEPTSKGRGQLVKKLKQLWKNKINITDQWAGIRPATKDRRPFIGQHPDHKQIFIFNGLGAKGVSLAPYFAEQLTNSMEKGTPVDQEVSIHRYKSLYS